jgi:hypothetical protein
MNSSVGKSISRAAKMEMTTQRAEPRSNAVANGTSSEQARTVMEELLLVGRWHGRW